MLCVLLTKVKKQYTRCPVKGGGCVELSGRCCSMLLAQCTTNTSRVTSRLRFTIYAVGVKTYMTYTFAFRTAIQPAGKTTFALVIKLLLKIKFKDITFSFHTLQP